MLVVKKVSQDFVFENPSLTAMTEELTRLRTGAAMKDLPTVEEGMAALIEKYSDFSKHIAGDKPSPTGVHVVVIGATGSLGAHTVAQLARQDDVPKVYCLVRASSQAVGQKRFRQSLMERYMYRMLSASALRKIVVLPAVFAEPHLGLSDQLYEQLSSDVTSEVRALEEGHYMKPEVVVGQLATLEVPGEAEVYPSIL